VSNDKPTISRRVLQNASYAGCHVGNPTIKIVEGDLNWQEAYNNWLRGKNPTSADDWKLGVFLHFEPVAEPSVEKKSFLYSVPGMNLVQTVGKIVLVICGSLVLLAMTALYWLFMRY
jgi:hypothetical protein